MEKIALTTMPDLSETLLDTGADEGDDQMAICHAWEIILKTSLILLNTNANDTSVIELTQWSGHNLITFKHVDLSSRMCNYFINFASAVFSSGLQNGEDQVWPLIGPLAAFS